MPTIFYVRVDFCIVRFVFSWLRNFRQYRLFGFAFRQNYAVSIFGFGVWVQAALIKEVAASATKERRLTR